MKSFLDLLTYSNVESKKIESKREDKKIPFNMKLKKSIYSK